MDIPWNYYQNDKNADVINDITNTESVPKDKMATEKQHNQENTVENDNRTVLNECESMADSTDVNDCIQDLLDCIQSDLCNQLESKTSENILDQEKLLTSKEFESIKEETMDEKTQQENHVLNIETKHDLINPVDLLSEVVCLDDEDPIKLIEDEQDVVYRPIETEKDPLELAQYTPREETVTSDQTATRNEENYIETKKDDHSSTAGAEIVEKTINEDTKTPISQKEIDAEKKKQEIFDITPAEDNEELCLIPDTKIFICQEETDAEIKKEQVSSTAEQKIFDKTPAEDNEELCLVLDTKIPVSQEETYTEIKKKQVSSTAEQKIFDNISAKDNEELCLIPDIKISISQEETDADTKKKQLSPTAEQEIFDKTPAEDNEELCRISDIKISISQEETDAKSKKKHVSSTAEQKIFDKTPAEDNEELCFIPDIKISISQEETDAETKKKQGSSTAEQKIFDKTPAEDNEELCRISDIKISISQEETDAKSKKKHVSSTAEQKIFDKTPAEDNEELCRIPDIKISISQEKTDAETKKKQLSPTAEQKIFDKTPAEDNEELCVISDIKISISQEKTDAETKKKELSPTAEQKIFDKTPAEDNEELCLISDIKISISQEKTDAETKKKQLSPTAEQKIFDKTPAEDNEELCRIPDIKISISQEDIDADTKKKHVSSTEQKIVDKSATEDNEDLCIIPDTKILIAPEETEKKKQVSSSTAEREIFGINLAENNEDLCIIPDTKTPISQKETDADTKKKQVSSTAEHDIFDISPAEDNEELCIIPDTKIHISQEENDTQTIGKKDTSVPTEETFHLEEYMASINNSSVESTDLQIKVINRLEHGEEATIETCHQCRTFKKCVYKVDNQEKTFLCSEICVISFRALNKPSDIQKQNIVCVAQNIFVRKCIECNTNIRNEDDNVLCWETLEFCNEDCLCQYQTKICSNCAYCKGPVWKNNLGKYCVRFGYDLRQFCRSSCLEEFKKGLKVCTYCQKDISDDSDGFLAPTNDKQFREFCSKLCVEKYENLNVKNNDGAVLPKLIINCDVCNIKRNVQVLFERRTNNESKKTYFCSPPCFIAYKFVNKLAPLQCETCKIYFETDNSIEFSLFYDQTVKHFCCKSCQNIYIIFNRRIVPCSWCKVKKYNFDMIKKNYNNDQTLTMCSLNCLSLFQVSVKAISTKKMRCDYCNKVTYAQYYLTMSDATVRNFCTNQCIVSFQNVLAKNKRLLQTMPKKCPAKNDANKLPVITNVQSLATQNPPQIIHHFIVKAPPLPPMKNACTSCEPIVHTKGTSCRPSQSTKETQTEQNTKERLALMPFPVPIYVPAPLPMFSVPVPVPVPFPLPIPVPVFIPTKRKTTAGIMKEMKKIQVKIPTDPYEAEMVMMAEMVAGDEKIDSSDSDSSCSSDEYTTENIPVHMDTNNLFEDDKMAADLNEPILDFEDSLTANTITTVQEPKTEPQEKEKKKICRKRPKHQAKNACPAKKGRLKSSEILPLQPIEQSENIIKPDANMSLKYMLGVNAWKLWISKTKSDLEKLSFCPDFKNDLLQLTAEELNYSLSQFVQEVRKPSGEEYAPDTIFYLCLGIQQYLFENGRIDNIFTDCYYEKFTDALDEISRKFSVLYDDSQYIVTRVEEEHLWEIKQLGVHSPYVLLHTLLYFNTKYFNLTTVEEHLQLTFSNIMRHWNDNKKETGTEAKQVFLKFYAPKNIWQSKPHKKKVYEQVENEENQFRCPVKLYEFYLTKTPECVKASRDKFYLTPERSCLPESPKWYTPMALSPNIVEKMLHRIKMVKEINVAMLAMA